MKTKREVDGWRTKGRRNIQQMDRRNCDVVMVTMIILWNMNTAMTQKAPHGYHARYKMKGGRALSLSLPEKTGGYPALFLSTIEQKSHPDVTCIQDTVRRLPKDSTMHATKEEFNATNDKTRLFKTLAQIVSSYLFVLEVLTSSKGRVHNGKLEEELGSQDESHGLLTSLVWMVECLDGDDCTGA